MTISTIVEVKCPSCNVEFGMPDDLYRKRKQDGADFYCPNGHQLHYGESENEKLKRRISVLERQVANLKDQIAYLRHQSNGYKGQWRKAVKALHYKPSIEPAPADLAHGE